MLYCGPGDSVNRDIAAVEVREPSIFLRGEADKKEVCTHLERRVEIDLITFVAHGEWTGNNEETLGVRNPHIELGSNQDIEGGNKRGKENPQKTSSETVMSLVNPQGLSLRRQDLSGWLLASPA